MFHVKQRRGLGLLLLVTVLGLLVAGCVSASKPRGWAGPVKAGDTLVVSTGGGRLDGFDRDGRRIWRFPDFWCVPDGSTDNLDGVYGKPAVSADGRVVFVGDYNGYVYAFRPGDVKLEVDCELDGLPASSTLNLGEPVIGGLTLDSASGRLFVTSGKQVFKVRAQSMIDALDGKVRIDNELFYETEGDIWSTPVVASGKVLFTSLDGYLYAVDPASNQLMWRFKADSGLVSTPVVVGDRVLVAGFGGILYSVDIDDGSEQWGFKASHWIWGEPAVAQDTAYVGDFDGIVHAVDIPSGTETWSVSLDKGPIRAAPAIASGTLIVSTDLGWLFGIDLSSREVAWQRDIGSKLNAGITVDGSNVYIAPQGCVTPEAGGEKVYYIQVNPSNGDLTAASGVC